MIERLKRLMQIKNLSPSQFGDEIKVQRSGMSHLISGRNKPSLEFILKILNHFPDVNPDWLLFGNEPVYRDGNSNLSFEEKPEISTDSTKISRNENNPVPQPSFMNGLFSESGKAGFDNEKAIMQTPKDQTTRQRQTQLKDTANGKKEASGEGQTASNPGNEEEIERIIIFDKNKSFVQYFPQ